MITIYVQSDGTITVRWPKGLMPDQESMSMVQKIIESAERR